MPDTEKNQDKYPQSDTQKKGLVSLSSEFEKNGARLIDFRKCYQRLGNKDGLFNLTRPARPDQETLVSFHQTLLGASGDWLEEKIANMLEIIGQHVVGNRSGRSEPRAVKRRPKPHKRLQHPRAQARRLKQYQGKVA